MSQAGVNNNTSGPVPPTVATTYTADNGSTATPSGNNLNVFGAMVADNDNVGIRTRAAGSTVTVQLTNRINVTNQTSNATPLVVGTIPLGATPGVYIFEGRISGFDTTNTSAASYKFTSAVRTTGAAGVEIATEYSEEFEEAGMSAADVSVGVSANDFIVTVTGIGTDVINWRTFFTYQFLTGTP